jgi:hypothetical protein
MSFPRLSLLLLPVALGLPMLTGACGAPVAIVAASYGADGVSLAESGKTATDHAASMVTKRDCALWRVFRNRNICQDREPGQADPYKVNYDEPSRQVGEGGIEYTTPAHAAANAPAASWDAAAYKPAPAASPAPTTAVAEVAPPPAVEPAPAPTPAPTSTPVKHKPHAKKVAKAPVKKPSPDQVVSSR